MWNGGETYDYPGDFDAAETERGKESVVKGAERAIEIKVTATNIVNINVQGSREKGESLSEPGDKENTEIGKMLREIMRRKEEAVENEQNTVVREHEGVGEVGEIKHLEDGNAGGTGETVSWNTTVIETTADIEKKQEEAGTSYVILIIVIVVVGVIICLIIYVIYLRYR